MTRRKFGSSLKWIVVAVAATAYLAGCGESRPATYPVEGVLRFEDGQPVPFGTVEFRSPAARVTARGKVDERGRFRLTTFSDGDGAVAGEHQVIVVQYVSSAALQQGAVHTDPSHASHGSQVAHRAALVPRKYADYSTSGLTANVEAGDANRITLQVARQK
jgi:hypothetical protein